MDYALLCYPNSTNIYQPSLASSSLSDIEQTDTDEVLRRLKRQPSSEGSTESENAAILPAGAQVVERADGTQVIRVKKRKRRSKQPKKEADQRSKKRKALVVLGTVVSLFVMALVVAFLLAYRNSSKFNTKVAEAILATSGAKAEIGTLGVTPQKVSVKKVELQWDRSFMESLELRDVYVKTHPLGFFGGTWRLEDFEAQKAILKLREGQRPVGEGDVPFEFEGGIFDAVELDCQFGESGVFLRDSSVRLRTDKGVSVDVEGGALELLQWGKLNVGSGFIKESGQGAELNLRLQSKDDYNEWLEIKGSVSNDYSVKNELKVTASSYPLENLLGSHLGKYLHGPFQASEGKAVLSPTDIKTLSLEVLLIGEGLRMSKWPFLVRLGQILEDSELQGYEFKDESQARFVYDQSVMKLSEISMATHNEFLLRGDIEVAANGELQGKLRMGISEDKEGYFEKKNALHVTRNGGDGYLWITVNLSGSVSAPKDDFGQQVSARPSQISPSSGSRQRGGFLEIQPSREQQLEDAFESLLEN